MQHYSKAGIIENSTTRTGKCICEVFIYLMPGAVIVEIGTDQNYLRPTECF